MNSNSTSGGAWRGVSASTKNQALSELLFQYREVLGVDLPWLDDLVWAGSCCLLLLNGNIQPQVSCHVLRQSLATHLLEDGYDIRTIQKLAWDSTTVHPLVSHCGR